MEAETSFQLVHGGAAARQQPAPQPSLETADGCPQHNQAGVQLSCQAGFHEQEATVQRDHEVCEVAVPEISAATAGMKVPVGHEIGVEEPSSICLSAFDADVGENAALQSTQAKEGEQASRSWFSYCYCWPSEEYFDAHPRRLVIGSTVVYAIPLSVAILIVQALDAVVAQKSHFLLAAFTAIRDSASLFTSLFIFFWYVEQSSVGKLKGQKDWQGIGGHFTFSTVTSVVGGSVAMVVLILIAKSLLGFTSPDDHRDGIVEIALTSQRIIASTLPATVYSTAAVGCLLGMNEVFKLASLLVFWSAVGTMGGIMLLNDLNCEPERLQHCPPGIVDTSSCALSYEEDGWICSQLEPFMQTSTLLLVGCTYGCAVSLAALQFWLVRKFKIPLFQVLGSREFRAIWTRDTLAVALRCLLNNSRTFISLVVALRMGITQGAVWVMFVSVSQMSYSIPNGLSVVAMINVSRLIGAGKHMIACQMLNDYRIFGLLCGLIFGAIVFMFGRTIVDQYANDVEQDDFNEILSPVWKWIVMFQPVISLVGVYGPLISATQHYVYWGKATVCTFLVVYIPFMVAGQQMQSVEMLVVGTLVYELCLLLSLYWVVHQVTWESILQNFQEMHTSFFLGTMPDFSSWSNSNKTNDGGGLGAIVSSISDREQEKARAEGRESSDGVADGSESLDRAGGFRVKSCAVPQPQGLCENEVDGVEVVGGSEDVDINLKKMACKV